MQNQGQQNQGMQMGSSGPVTVDVTETSFKIALSTDNVPAGTVTFHVKNQAEAVPHQLTVIKTDQPADQLPTSDNKVDTSGLNVVGGSDNIQAGENQDLTVDLTPGTYVLICNLPGHYQNGMYTSFTVQGAQGQQGQAQQNQGQQNRAEPAEPGPAEPGPAARTRASKTRAAEPAAAEPAGQQNQPNQGQAQQAQMGSSGAVTVTIQNYAYDPPTLQVQAGTTVTWINQDAAPHTVTSLSGSELASDTLNKGGTYSHTFTTPGTYDYYCTIHPYMKASVEVGSQGQSQTQNQPQQNQGQNQGQYQGQQPGQLVKP